MVDLSKKKTATEKAINSLPIRQELAAHLLGMLARAQVRAMYVNAQFELNPRREPKHG